MLDKAQLAFLPPAADGRRAVRRIVNIAASLREPGATICGAEIRNLSTGGFLAVTEQPLEAGSELWLKLPGMEPWRCTVKWREGDKVGFEFETPLHQATLDLVVAAGRRPIKRHFGPLAGR